MLSLPALSCCLFLAAQLNRYIQTLRSLSDAYTARSNISRYDLLP